MELSTVQDDLLLRLATAVFVSRISHLNNDGPQAALKFLDNIAEREEVLVKLLDVHVQRIIGELLELFNSSLKVLVDLLDRTRQSLPLQHGTEG